MFHRSRHARSSRTTITYRTTRPEPAMTQRLQPRNQGWTRLIHSLRSRRPRLMRRIHPPGRPSSDQNRRAVACSTSDVENSFCQPRTALPRNTAPDINSGPREADSDRIGTALPRFFVNPTSSRVDAAQSASVSTDRPVNRGRWRDSAEPRGQFPCPGPGAETRDNSADTLLIPHEEQAVNLRGGPCGCDEE